MSYASLPDCTDLEVEQPACSLLLQRANLVMGFGEPVMTCPDLKIVQLMYMLSPGWKDPSPVSVALPSGSFKEMNAASGDTRNGIFGFGSADSNKPRMKQEGFK